MQSAELRGKRGSRAHLRTDKPITYRFTQPDNIAAPHGSNPEKSCPPRERPDEVIRPYGSNPDKSHRRFPIHPTGTRCRALICAEIEREANPKRRRSAPDDRAVLIAALVFSCEAALSSQRKIRGSRKRGYKKPQVSCTPFCPSPREGRVPARRSVHFPGCRPAATLPPPKAAIPPARRSVRNPRRRRRPKRHSPSEGETPPSRGMGSTSPPASAPQYRRKIPRSPSEGEQGACPLRTHFPLFWGDNYSAFRNKENHNEQIR